MKKMLWVFWIGLAFGCGEDSSPEGPVSSNNTIQTNNQSTTPDECVPSAGGIELCDGIDNDCDGEIDEEYTEIGDSCTAGVGVCTTDGTFQCGEDQLGVSCLASTPVEPSDEVCDGLDNDCDGEVDETFGDLGSDCTIGVGDCASSGLFVCTEDGASTTCDAEPVFCPPDPTTLALSTEKPKTFLFEWDPVPNTTEFRLMEKLTEASDFELIATIPADEQSYEYYTFLPDKVNARYLVESCNADGCVPSNEVTTTAVLNDAIGYFKASNAESDDFFVVPAISQTGTLLAIAAPLEDSAPSANQFDNSAENTGVVYLFEKVGNEWSQIAFIKPLDSKPGDNFGNGLAMSSDGSTLVVASPNESSNATGVNGVSTGTLQNSGAVYVFVRSGDTWNQEAKIKALHPDEFDSFGNVSISGDGNTLVASSTGEDSAATGVNGDPTDNTAEGSGAVFVFERVGGTWAQTAYIKPSNTHTFQSFSSARISRDGSTVAVGAFGDRSSATGINGNQSLDDAEFAGAVFVFRRSNNTWVQEAYIKPSNTREYQVFGSVSLSADGGVLAVGSTGENSGARGINGDQSSVSSPASGAVYVFRHGAGGWTQEAYIKASNSDAEDSFGGTVSLSDSGNTLVVGAQEDSGGNGFGASPSDNSADQSGAFYIFNFVANQWTESAYVKAPNSDPGDGFQGIISGDGNTIVGLAPFESSSATGIGGDQNDNSSPNSGAVYLY